MKQQTKTPKRNNNKKGRGSRLLLAFLIALVVTAAVTTAAVFLYHGVLLPSVEDKPLDDFASLYGTPVPGGTTVTESPTHSSTQPPTNNPSATPNGTPTITPDGSDNPQPTPDNTNPSTQTPIPTETDRPTLPAFERLIQTNKDIAGWLIVEGIGVNHPVFYTPNNQNYYLYRAPDGSHSSQGSLFMSTGSEINPQAQVLVIHGHNMHVSGRMFGRMTKFKSYDFMKNNRTFRFDTIYQEGDWKIIGIVTASVDMGANDFYYPKNNYANEEEFQDFLYKLRVRSLYQIEDDTRFDDKIVILSTCDRTDFGKNQRLLIFARRLREGESIYDVTSSMYHKNNTPLMPVEWYRKHNKSKPSEQTLLENYERFYGPLEVTP